MKLGEAIYKAQQIKPDSEKMIGKKMMKEKKTIMLLMLILKK
jgi:hypothetical protein